MKYLGISAVGQLFQDSVDRTVVTTPGCYGAQPLGFGADKPGYNVAYGGPGGLYCDIP
uniref:Neprosin domain-containing protein n=1 Tax=Oryza rufipogon TaxID=4529 RepID=A0A0E0PTF6_ORYRU